MKSGFVFELGGMLWSHEAYVYDGSDEIANSAQERSAQWKERAARTDLSWCSYSAIPLGGHFYAVTFTC
jgi:hypothetical protein